MAKSKGGTMAHHPAMKAHDKAMQAHHKFLAGAINPEHKGYCTPMTKSTCTPRRKALARRLKKGGDLYSG